MVESVDMMLKRWKETGNKEMEVYEEFTILSSEVISRTAFGSSYKEGKQVFEKLEQLITVELIILDYFWNPIMTSMKV